ncbi:MAG: hypothetical protein AB8F95_16155 [Bacteroidia bacterium]
MTNSNIFFIAILGLLLTTIACEKEPDPKLQEAFKVHLNSIEVQGQVKEMLNESDLILARLTEAFKALDLKVNAERGNMISMAATSLQSFRPSYAKWEEALVEVPGIEHAHDHADGEHHHHAAVPDHIKNMSPDQVLQLQKDLLVKIEGLRGALEMAISDAKQVLEAA